MDLLDSIAPDVDFNAEPEAETPETSVPEAPEIQEAPEAKAPPVEAPEKPQKLVPLEALHESRIKEREWRDKAAQVERDAQERFKKLEERLERLANPPPEVPDFAQDPAGNLKHNLDATRAEMEAMRQSAEQSRSVQEAQELERQIASTTQAAEQIFAKDHPDYLGAVKHLQDVADRNLQMMGLDDPVARQAQIRKDALAMSFKALQMGKSPAEVAYNLAVNYGYKATQTDTGKKIIALQEGQKTAAMPSGGSKASAVTLATLEGMDDDEFNKLVDDPSSWSKLIRQMV